MGDKPQQRRYPRVAVQAAVDLHHEGLTSALELRDISLGGAFVEARAPISLGKGAGVRLEFTLPQSFRVHVFGRIVWVRKQSDAMGPPGYGVEFYGLDDVNREFIAYYLASSGPAAEVARGNIYERFQVTMEGPRRLYVKMTGSLTEIESRALAASVCEKLGEVSGEELLTFIDVSELGACARTSLDHMRTWLQRLREKAQLAGVLVGPDSVGVVQMRRLAREACLADALVTFADNANARRFYAQLCGALGHHS